MNKNSSFNEPFNADLIRYQIYSKQAEEARLSLGCINQPKKEKKMNREYPFHVDWQDFKTLEEATKFARKQTMHSKEDTVIRQDVAVVKFPVPDYEVEAIVPAA